MPRRPEVAPENLGSSMKIPEPNNDGLHRVALLLLPIVLGLSACGGGGSANDVDDTKQSSGSLAPGVGATTQSPAGSPASTDPPSPSSPATVTAPPTPGAAVPARGDNKVGVWSPGVIPWSDGRKAILPLHAALLPDGRVMSYGTHTETPTGNYEFNYDLWSPPVGSLSAAEGTTRHQILPTGITTHLFCSAQILIPANGQLLLTGGDNWSPATAANTNLGNRDYNLFDPVRNVITAGGQMFEPRWYASPLTLPNGQTYVQGGTDGRAVYGGVPDHATRAEVRDPVTGASRVLTGFGTGDLDNNYPRNFVGPDGRIWGFDHQILYRIDPAGNGSRVDLYNDDFQFGWTATATAVMFRPGKILVNGIGGWIDQDGRTSQIIDINGPTPVIRSVARHSQRRQWANSTVLPDGKVVLMGGSELNAIEDTNTFATGRIGYQIDLYDPVGNTWTPGPAQQRMRLYHSIALLLPNGSVLSAGGGWPGPQLNRDAEIYYPPYLFNADGSWAARPQLNLVRQSGRALVTGVDVQVADPGSMLELDTADAADIARVTLVKTGSVTHSFNFEQRFIELGKVGDPTRPIGRNGTRLQVKLPANAFETTPGFYLVFVINSAGVPSEARTIRINPL